MCLRGLKIPLLVFAGVYIVHFNHPFSPPPSPGNHFFSPTLRNAPVGAKPPPAAGGGAGGGVAAKILKFSTLKDEFLHHFREYFPSLQGF